MTVSRATFPNTHFTLSRIMPGFMRLMEWGMDSQALLDFIKALMDMGITSFDHADIYGDYQSEAAFGAALALEPSLREKMELVTKCGIKLVSENRPAHKVHSYDTTQAHIMVSVENSLKNLHTDYLDLLLIHRPDPLMDPDEVAKAFVSLHQSGKVRYFGVSNFTHTQFDLLQSRLPFDLITNQVEFSVTHMEPMHDGTFDQCVQRRIPPMIWSPLGGGSIFKGETVQSARVKAALETIGKDVNASIDQVALAWVMKHPSRPIPVLGSGKLDRYKAAVAAEQVVLMRDQWFAVWEASAGHEVP